MTTVLDDLDIPPQEESFVKKSIFRRAKENIISRFGDSDKGNIFGRRNSKDKDGVQNASVNSAERVLPVTSAAGTSQLPNNSTVASRLPAMTNVKFTTLDELHSRGLMRKIIGKNQFFRHIGNKLDVSLACKTWNIQLYSLQCTLYIINTKAQLECLTFIDLNRYLKPTSDKLEQ